MTRAEARALCAQARVLLRRDDAEDRALAAKLRAHRQACELVS